MNNIFYRYRLSALLAALAVSLFTSCMDTEVLPADKTIEEDFWKTKADVQLMVVGTYKKLVSQDALTRMMLWGSLRGDEFVVNETPTGSVPNALMEVQAADIQNTNTFCDWSSLYSVINYCNIVLAKAEGVTKIDPSYTYDDYVIDRSQMLAIRALCYFYLVRTYRDVPLCLTGFTESSQELEIEQSAPLAVLDRCIADLTEAKESAIVPDGFKDWRRVGYFTQNGILALLADIYLWRGSMTHDKADYAAAVECCEKVIASKVAMYPKDVLDEEASDYALLNGEQAFRQLFVEGNSQEAVMELQLDGKNNSNNTVCNYYYLYSKSASHGYLLVTPLFSGTGNGKVYSNARDYRYWMNTYDVGSTTATYFDVRKMVTQNTNTVDPDNAPAAFKRTSETRAYGEFAQNWMLYRLTDVMLMEAEARVAMAEGDGDIRLRQAFNLVKEVNARSLSVKSDSIKFASYASVDAMETLVLEERMRELCFEGKRWFDLMRYNYRHITPSDPLKTLAQLSDEGAEFPRNDETMLNLMARKYETTGNGAGVIAKMRTEPYLYWPVSERELKVNARLRQNPVYNTDNIYEKN